MKNTLYINDLEIFMVKSLKLAIGDNMPILEFQKSGLVLRCSRAYKRRLFLKFFISMKKTPSQGQKTILFKFEQYGMGLDMF